MQWQQQQLQQQRQGDSERPLRFQMDGPKMDIETDPHSAPWSLKCRSLRLSGPQISKKILSGYPKGAAFCRLQIVWMINKSSWREQEARLRWSEQWGVSSETVSEAVPSFWIFCNEVNGTKHQSVYSGALFGMVLCGVVLSSSINMCLALVEQIHESWSSLRCLISAVGTHRLESIQPSSVLQAQCLCLAGVKSPGRHWIHYIWWPTEKTQLQCFWLDSVLKDKMPRSGFFAMAVWVFLQEIFRSSFQLSGKYTWTKLTCKCSKLCSCLFWRQRHGQILVVRDSKSID